MSFTLDPNISKYIDVAIERERVIFNADMKREIGVLSEGFQTKLTLMGETVDLKIRETAREVIKEEVVPRFEILETKMDMVVSEIKDMKGEMVAYRKDTDQLKEEIATYRKDTNNFKEEMRALRKDSNNHNVRLNRLERVAA